VGFLIALVRNSAFMFKTKAAEIAKAEGGIVASD
jgi:hypothetical protein